jgi:hypothetical protein
MNTQLRRWRRHLHTTMRTAGLRLGRPVAVLAAACALLSVAGAASASTPVPPPGGYGPVPGAAATITRVITTGGMPGWQIALIALGAALVAATAAVILDRTLARRRPASAMTA